AGRCVAGLQAARWPDRSPLHAPRRGRGGSCRSAADAVSQRGVFLDRDGTLIEEVGYLDRKERVDLYPWTIDAVRALNRAGFRAVLVSNQSGVARGFFSETVVDE